jgi:hypothetical protein
LDIVFQKFQLFSQQLGNGWVLFQEFRREGVAQQVGIV